MMGKRIEVREGAVFYASNKDKARYAWRRVVAVVNDLIVYSVGGDRNYCCKRNTFLKWRRGNL